MLKRDLILRNPMRLLGKEGEDILEGGGFGAVEARAGVGKTALLVQLALNTLLQGKNVLHIALDEPVGKICLWYEEVFRNIALHYKIKDMDRLWEEILPHRFIMTFKSGGFSSLRLEERLAELGDQDIFLPQMILIDGLEFDDQVGPTLSALKDLAKAGKFHMWFAVLSHRHEVKPGDELHPRLEPVAGYFKKILQLQPTTGFIRVRALKGGGEDDSPPELILDPGTMLIRTR